MDCATGLLLLALVQSLTLSYPPHRARSPNPRLNILRNAPHQRTRRARPTWEATQVFPAETYHPRVSGILF
jgi:hypothetical protein